jgi:hypothetical protein
MVIARRIRARPYYSCMAGEELSRTYLTLAQIADRMGWKLKTARTLHHRASRRRAAGKARPGDLPKEDWRFGRTPVWLEKTIDDWEARRPGQGAGGGPKPLP